MEFPHADRLTFDLIGTDQDRVLQFGENIQEPRIRFEVCRDHRLMRGGLALTVIGTKAGEIPLMEERRDVPIPTVTEPLIEGFKILSSMRRS